MKPRQGIWLTGQENVINDFDQQEYDGAIVAKNKLCRVSNHFSVRNFALEVADTLLPKTARIRVWSSLVNVYSPE